MMRTLAEVQDDIARCNWLRTHLHDLSEVLEQDTVLARLTKERDSLTAKTPAGRPS